MVTVPSGQHMSVHQAILQVGLSCWLHGEDRESHLMLRSQKRGNGKIMTSVIASPLQFALPHNLPHPGFILNIEASSWSSHMCLYISSKLSFSVQTCWPCPVLLSRPAVHCAVVTGAQPIRHHWSQWTTLNTPYSGLLLFG